LIKRRFAKGGSGISTAGDGNEGVIMERLNLIEKTCRKVTAARALQGTWLINVFEKLGVRIEIKAQNKV
jgi:hypothetical protein